MKPDAWVAGCARELSGFDATEHIITNAIITLGSESARYLSNMVAQHVVHNACGMADCWADGHYIHGLRGINGARKIVSYRLNVTWNRGDAMIFQLAIAR